MKAKEITQNKILDRQNLANSLARWRFKQKKIVFTNGCFDLFHIGHLELIQEAATLGDILLIGLNSDVSVKRLKGVERPINNEQWRAKILAALFCVDAVVIFEEDTPYELIKIIQPDILVKGGDYKKSDIVGADLVEAKGGQVCIYPIVEGVSSTILLQKSKG